jgi:hypothetical protein
VRAEPAFSTKSQNIANVFVHGSVPINAPTRSLRLASSEMKAKLRKPSNQIKMFAEESA